MALLKQVPRTGKRLSSKNEDYDSNPPILCNSFPKSGTHLLLQILGSFPRIVNYGAFIASIPSISFRERTKASHIRLIRNIVPGEIVPAHLFYEPDYFDELIEKRAVIFFIYRDPRDVAVSEAYYLTYMNPWHGLHSYFSKKLQSSEERILATIKGINDPTFSYDYPNISDRFKRYQRWIGKENVFTVKFENLVSENRKELLVQMADFYARRSQLDLDIEEVVNSALLNINPAHSHTFRKGEAGGWQKVFNEELKEQAKIVAGDLLIELGYEKDLNW